MEIKVILFDLGGVLINIDFFNFKQLLLKFKNTNKRKEILDQEYELIFKKYHQGLISDTIFYEEICAIFNIEEQTLSKSFFFKEFNKIILNLNEGVFIILKKITEKKRYNLICLSNINSSHLNILKKKFRGLLVYFNELVFSNEYHSVKPDQEIYKIIVQKTQCIPGEILLIDDSIENIEVAKKIGFQGILYKNINDLLDKLYNFGINL
ncbi:MAG: HAD-IA family hydrolase [Candidatus Lokiarchaeota archaeon]|nr:HAD-IA family hydrolase [Candidatus Lokiarchaeota archaeon]